jgi:hypothetical protein
MYAFEYALDKAGRRVLRGLSFEETTEFELLSAARPMERSTVGSLPNHLRWLELMSTPAQPRRLHSKKICRG